jgi:hypothetical protein
LTRIRLLALAIFLALGTGLVAAGCGGEDPEEVLEDAAAASTDVNSGTVSVTVDLATDQGDANLNLTGPFEAVEGGFPKFDLDATVAGDVLGQSIEGVEGGIISTGEAGYVTYGGVNYELDPQTFQQFATAFEAARASQPTTTEDGFSTDGLTDLENEGDEDVEGVETTHVSASLDTSTLEEPAASVVQDATFDIYVGKDDDLVRRADISVQLDTAGILGVLAPSAPEAGVVTLGVSFTLGEVNEPQTIEAPADAEPFDQLLDELGASGLPLGLGLGGVPGGDTFDFDGPGGVSPGGGTGGGGGGATGAPDDAYLECVQQAEDAEAIAECVEQAP